MYSLPGLNEIVTSNVTKLQWKTVYTKAINSYWTRQFVKDIRSKKSLCYLKTHGLRIGYCSFSVEKDRDCWTGQEMYC